MVREESRDCPAALPFRYHGFWFVFICLKNKKLVLREKKKYINEQSEIYLECSW